MYVLSSYVCTIVFFPRNISKFEINLGSIFLSEIGLVTSCEVSFIDPKNLEFTIASCYHIPNIVSLHIRTARRTYNATKG